MMTPMGSEIDDKLEALKRAARAYQGSGQSLPAVRARLLDDLGKAADAWAALERTRRSGAYRLNTPKDPEDK